MLSRRCQNSQKSENTQNSEVNSKFFFSICWKHDTPLQWLGIVLLLFTIPFYHFQFSRYLDLTEHHFSSDILVPFLDLSDLYSHEAFFRLFLNSVQLGFLNKDLSFFIEFLLLQSIKKCIYTYIQFLFFRIKNWYIMITQTILTDNIDLLEYDVEHVRIVFLSFSFKFKPLCIVSAHFKTNQLLLQSTIKLF